MGKVKKKPYIRYVILGILATLMVGCIIRIAMPNREWNYTGSYTFTEGESYAEPIDIHDPVRNAKNSGFLPEEREWMTRFLSAGFIDSFRLLYPEKQEYTGWSCPTNAPGMLSRSAL